MPISYELVTFRLSTGGYKPSRALYRRALLQIRIQASVELRLDHNVDTFQVVAVEELSRQPEQTCYRRRSPFGPE